RPAGGLARNLRRARRRPGSNRVGGVNGWRTGGRPGDARAPVVSATRSVEYDPSDGTPFAVLPDGKAVLTLAVTERRSKTGEVIGGSAVVRLLDAATGE